MKIQKFFYNDISVSFNEQHYLNATAIAKHFYKFVKDYLKTAQTQDYIAALAKNLSVRNIILTADDLVIVRQGGIEQGTWLHPKLAVNFARWLSADFAVWCDLKIDSLINGENQQMPQIPQTLSEALRLAADQAEQIERQNLLLEQQRPKVEFVQRYVEVGTTKSLRETAKILKVPERAMIDCLVGDGLLFRQSGNLLPYQKYHVKGLFDVKTGTTEYGHNYTQTRVTSKGIEYIASRYASELM